MMSKKVAVILAFVMSLVFAPAVLAEEAQVDSQLDWIEHTLYGRDRDGGLLERLNAVEQDLFGRPLPGSLVERQNGVSGFLMDSSSSNPSLLSKLALIEWSLSISDQNDRPVRDRVLFLERRLEGASRESEPLAQRVDRLLRLAISGTEVATFSPVEVPAGELVRVSLMEDLSPTVVKKGQEISFKLTHDVVVDNKLVAPAGSHVSGEVTKVKKPGMFGRPSEIMIKARDLYSISAYDIPLSMDVDKKRIEANESSYLGAAGATLGGVILLGPVGLVGGLFVRGNAKHVPVGTIVYAEVASPTTVMGYDIPEGMLGSVKNIGNPATASFAPTNIEASSDDGALYEDVPADSDEVL